MSDFYWEQASVLLAELVKKDCYLDINEQFKSEIIKTIRLQLNQSNYLISKLLIRAKIDEEILLNFVFYNSINKEKLLILYNKNPDKFGKTFMFNLHPVQLPKIKNILSQDEFLNLSNESDLYSKIVEIDNISGKQLQKLFPKSYKSHGIINPYVNKNTL